MEKRYDPKYEHPDREGISDWEIIAKCYRRLFASHRFMSGAEARYNENLERRRGGERARINHKQAIEKPTVDRDSKGKSDDLKGIAP